MIHGGKHTCLVQSECVPSLPVIYVPLEVSLAQWGLRWSCQSVENCSYSPRTILSCLISPNLASKEASLKWPLGSVSLQTPAPGSFCLSVGIQPSLEQNPHQRKCCQVCRKGIRCYICNAYSCPCSRMPLSQIHTWLWI